MSMLHLKDLARSFEKSRLVGWLMRFNLPLSTVIGYIGEDGDDMRMIGHEMRESPLFERTARSFKCSIDTNTPRLF